MENEQSALMQHGSAGLVSSAANNPFTQLVEYYQQTIKQIELRPHEWGLNPQALFHKAISQYVEKKDESEVKTWLQTLKRDQKDIFRQHLSEKDTLLGFSLSHYFAAKGCYTLYQYLTHQGFAADATTSAGFTANQLAILYTQYDFLDKALSQPYPHLTSSPVIINQCLTLNINELHFAIMCNDLKAVKLIFDRVKDIEHTVPHVGSVLNLAIIFSDSAMVQFLLHQHYKNNITPRQLIAIKESEHSMNALTLAAHLGKYSMVKYLLNIVSSDITPANATDRIDYEKPDPKTQVYRNLVFQGGGMKGTIYPYVLQSLETACQARQIYCKNQLGYDEDRVLSLGMTSIKRVAGTSAGSIFALGFALGAKANALEQMVNEDFSQFLDTAELKALSETLMQLSATLMQKNVTWRSAVEQLMAQSTTLKDLYDLAQEIYTINEKIGGISATNLIKHPLYAKALYTAAQTIKQKLSLLYHDMQMQDKNFKGFSTGDAIYQWLVKFMKAQGIIDPMRYTFGDLARDIQSRIKPYTHLYITVTCLETQTPIVLNSESLQQEYYDYVILDAIRASMSIPIAFTPWQLARITPRGEVTRTDYHFVDGGVLRNYPITEFDRKRFTDASAVGNSEHPTLNKATLGFCFQPQPVQPLKGNLTLHEFIKGLAEMYLDAENILSMYEDREYGRSIYLDTQHVTTFAFKALDPSEKAMLARNAQKAVKHYFFGQKSGISEQLSRWGNPVFDRSWDSDEETNPNNNAPQFSSRIESMG